MFLGDALDAGAGALAVVPQAHQFGDLGHRKAQITPALDELQGAHVGFAVLATVTAQISSSFIDQAARARAKQSATEPGPRAEVASMQTIADRLSGIEAQLQRPVPPA